MINQTVQQLDVALSERSYPIYIGTNLLDNQIILQRHIKNQQVLVVTDSQIAKLYLNQIMAAFDGYQIASLILPEGEQHKTWATLSLIFDRLMALRHNRDTTLLALGGGVIGDLTGFAAAIYQRGVDFIQLPTTFLSQVDSSVGGKTGINHPLGKNMIGAFHQPQSVIIDTHTLSTLSARELSAGLAEVIKYGLIGDMEFFTWLEHNMPGLRQLQPELICRAIRLSCANKAKIVAQDEREQSCRALLNLGHTFGHAIEARQGYGQWLHGEAVAVGIVMAADLSVRLGWLEAVLARRIEKLIAAAGLPLSPPTDMSVAEFMHYMATDKKVLQGRLRLVLLNGLGKAHVTADFDIRLLEMTLERFCS